MNPLKQYPDIENYLEKITKSLTKNLGEKLLGLYLTRSLTTTHFYVPTIYLWS